MTARALHFVFKTTNRQKTYDFYVKKLGMKILRHEEFGAPCEATCNGPFDGKWSKTMIGYGSEDQHFVFELVYNYGIKKIEHGNEFNAIVLAVDGVETQNDPDGYKFVAEKASAAPGENKVVKVVLNVEDLARSKAFWNGVVGMPVTAETSESLTLSYGNDQTALQLVSTGKPIKRATASGRIAFSTPTASLEGLQAKVEAANAKRIQNKLVALPTPGKATVHVVILTDPDGHEICFVGDEAFRELSAVDPEADNLLKKAIKDDWSDEFMAKNR